MPYFAGLIPFKVLSVSEVNFTSSAFIIGRISDQFTDRVVQVDEPDDHGAI